MLQVDIIAGSCCNKAKPINGITSHLLTSISKKKPLKDVKSDQKSCLLTADAKEKLLALSAAIINQHDAQLPLHYAKGASKIAVRESLQAIDCLDCVAT